MNLKKQGEIPGYDWSLAHLVLGIFGASQSARARAVITGLFVFHQLVGDHMGENPEPWGETIKDFAYYGVGFVMGDSVNSIKTKKRAR